MSTVEQVQEIQHKTASEREIDWITIIKRCRASGLSQSAYCKMNKINYNQFVYQKSKISARSKANAKLLPVKVTQSDPIIPAQNNFMLHYPNGLKLSIPVNASQEAIKALLNCLEG